MNRDEYPHFQSKIDGFCYIYIEFDGKCYKIDGNGHLGGGHVCAVVQWKIFFGRWEDAENPGESRRQIKPLKMKKLILLVLSILCFAFMTYGQQAVFFDGVNQHLSFPGAKMPAGNSARTVEFWMKSNLRTNTTNNRELIIDLSTKSQDGSAFGIFTEVQNNKTYLSFWGHNRDKPKMAVIPDDEWHFVAITFNGGNLQCYIDGIRKFQADIQLNTNNSGSCYIGGNPNHSSYFTYFNGAVRSVSIWNTARNEDQIKLDMIPYHGSTAPYKLTATEPGLIAHFPLNEGSGTTFQDMAKLITGKLENGAGWTKAINANPSMTDEGIWFVIQNKADVDTDLGVPARRLAMSVNEKNEVVMAPIPMEYGSDMSAFLWRIFIKDYGRKKVLTHIINKKLGDKKVLASWETNNPHIEDIGTNQGRNWPYIVLSNLSQRGTNVYNMSTASSGPNRATVFYNGRLAETSKNSNTDQAWVFQPMNLDIGYHIPTPPEHIASWGGTTIATAPFTKTLTLSNGITIFATNTASDWALLNAHLIYNNMLNALEPDKLGALSTNIPTDWRREVHILSKHDLNEVAHNYPIINGIWSQDAIESYRGSQGYDPSRKLFVTTITEEMMCKNGVHARATDGTDHDDLQYREFDQVVHEFAHALDNGCGMRGRNTPACFMGRGNEVECYAASVQAWFGNNYSYTSFKDRANTTRIIHRDNLKQGQVDLYNYIDQGFNALNTWLPPRKFRDRELKHELPSGTVLLPTDETFFWSFSENYHLKLQDDGNLVIKDIGGWGSGHKWGSGNIMQVSHNGVKKAIFQDGWVKFYNASGTEVDKFGIDAPGSFLVISSEEPMPVADKREVAGSWIKVEDANGHLLWPKHVMEPGDELLPYNTGGNWDQFYESFSKKYRLTLNAEGRLEIKESGVQKWISPAPSQSAHGPGVATKVKFENGWIKFLASNGTEVQKIGGKNGQDAPGACLIVCSEPVTGNAYLKIVNDKGTQLWVSQ
jgi:hypothetical protein